MRKMSWVWLAGFFEGEGSVYYKAGKEGTKQGVHGRAILGQKDKEALQAIYDFLHENNFRNVSFLLRKANKYSGPVWVLYISKRDDVIRFYERIIPYLFEKKKEAENVVSLLKKDIRERDEILKKASGLRLSGRTWHEISRELGVGRISLTNYMRSAGIDVVATSDNQNERERRQDKISRGLCEACGEERGSDGTKRKCRICSDKYNAWRNKKRTSSKPK